MLFISLCSLVFIGFFSSISLEAQATPCSFHLCTPERLKCSTGNLLRNEQGCKLCKCEATPSLRNSSCLLHGCTVNLLRCVGELRISVDGCTLCECDELGIRPTESNRRTIVFEIPTKVPETTISTTTVPSNVCPPVQCGNLNCTRLKRSPVTGCPVCQCDNANATDLCPKSQELLAGESMRRAPNNFQGRLKYKLFIRKLKKGFVPNQLYKVTLKSVDTSHPFKEFLLEVGATPHVVVKANKRGRKIRRTVPRYPNAEEERRNARECGTGYWTPSKNPRTTQGRVFPDCNTAVMHVDKNTNKTSAILTWAAPKCGCVYIRASVVDFTGNSAYLYENSSWASRTSASANSQSASATARINQPLYRVVCARTSQASKRKSVRPKKKLKQTRGKVKDSIAIKCCHAAQKPRSNNGCDRGATTYAESFTRFKVMKRTCKNAYKECCRLFTSKVSGRISNRANNTAPAGRHQHWRLDGGIPFPRRIFSSAGNGNQNERPKKKKKKVMGRKTMNPISPNRRTRQRHQSH